MARHRVVVFDATLTPLAELPLSGLQYSRVLSGAGALTGSLSMRHPACTETNLGQLKTDPDRLFAVYREDGNTVTCEWAGPLTGTDCTFSDGSINVVGREMSWWLGKRVCEEDISLESLDMFAGVRALVTQMTTKTATGTDGTLAAGTDIGAAIAGFNVTGASAGYTLPANTATNYVGFRGVGRHTYADAFGVLAGDPEHGFEWAMDYRTGSTRVDIITTLLLGYPNLGSTWGGQIAQSVLVDFARFCDWEQGATRVHVFGGDGYIKTLQSSQAATNGVRLTERVDDFGDITNTDFIDGKAKDLRRLGRPAPRTMTFKYKPCPSLPYGFVDLGDTVPQQISDPNILSIESDVRRVVQVDATADDTSEEILVTLNDPLTDLAA